MKTITIKFTNEQTENIEQLRKMGKKNAADFIREALICLIPLSEKSEVKKNLITIHKKSHSPQAKDIIERQIRDINTGLKKRLKRIRII